MHRNIYCSGAIRIILFGVKKRIPERNKSKTLRHQRNPLRRGAFFRPSGGALEGPTEEAKVGAAQEVRAFAGSLAAGRQWNEDGWGLGVRGKGEVVHEGTGGMEPRMERVLGEGWGG